VKHTLRFGFVAIGLVLACSSEKVPVGADDAGTGGSGGREPGAQCQTNAECLSQVCLSGVCTTPACTDGRKNGSETDIDCGGPSCAPCANGKACQVAADCSDGACTAGICQTSTCAPGHQDCNHDPTDGCEADVATDANNCGACGVACSAAHAASACVAGSCTVQACDAGYGDCDGNGADGCETNLGTDVNNCGACATECDAGRTCSDGLCGGGAPTCSDGVLDGTETDIDCGGSCPACLVGQVCLVAVDCTSGVCSTGHCQPAPCSGSNRDCNGVAADGCEAVTATDVQNCGACGVSCSMANATPVCVLGACRVQQCDAGFGNCDANDANGCEVNLGTDVNNCGACANVCNSGQSCNAGRCGPG